MNRNHEGDSPADLESQFILRLPPEPAKVLREAISSGSNLKDRINIKIENDMRYGEVRIDHWLMHAKVVDIPTIVESLKTIDNKSFYKTADICQMLICKEEDDQTTDDDSPMKTKKKDSNKVDKKFLWPHGITPPLKNVRRRRFRKTLRKKNVEAPEIEKEVKRLLKSDNESVSVKWEVISEDDEHKINKTVVNMKDAAHESTSANIAEHDIFGGAVSDSEEEVEMDENSRLSAEDSRMSDTNSIQNLHSESQLATEFTSEMFNERPPQSPLSFYQQQQAQTQQQQQQAQHQSVVSSYAQNLSRPNIEARLDEIQVALADLKGRRQQKEMEITNIENHTLRQRFQDILDNLLQDQSELEGQQYQLQQLLNQT